MGFINKEGKEVTPIKYEDASNFNGGMAAVKFDKKWGFVDKSGKEVIPIKYGYLSVVDTAIFKEGLLLTELDRKWGFIDKKGREAIPIKYQRANSFSEGLAAVQLNNKWGFIDKTDNAVIEIRYWDVKDFGEGLAAIRLDGKWGFINKTGKEVIERKYEDVPFYEGRFSEGLAPVKLNNKWGFIDKEGKEVISPQYDQIIFGFYGGQAKVKKDGQNFYIDKTGIPVDNKDMSKTTDGTEKNITSTSQNTIAKTETKANEATVKLVTPPLPLKGKIDATLTGLWKYTDGSGKITYLKFNADGTSTSYNGSVSTANKSKDKGYWRVDGAFIEFTWDKVKKVDRFDLQKGYDATTGKPTLAIGWATYFPAFEKKSW